MVFLKTWTNFKQNIMGYSNKINLPTEIRMDSAHGGLSCNRLKFLSTWHTQQCTSLCTDTHSVAYPYVTDKLVKMLNENRALCITVRLKLKGRCRYVLHKYRSCYEAPYSWLSCCCRITQEKYLAHVESLHVFPKHAQILSRYSDFIWGQKYAQTLFFLCRFANPLKQSNQTVPQSTPWLFLSHFSICQDKPFSFSVWDTWYHQHWQLRAI